MTEDEWLSCSDPTLMMRWLRGRVSNRKFRLAAVAVARLLAHRLPDDLRSAVDVGERAADGQASREEQVEFVSRLYSVVVDHGKRTGENWFVVNTAEDISAVYSAIRAVGCAPPDRDVANSPAWKLTLGANAERHPPLLKDIVGNPFRPIVFSPELRTSMVVSLAQQMYESRDFSGMPILADALEDQGCGDQNILSHCRGPGPHVRGCWAVDRVLGKE